MLKISKSNFFKNFLNTFICFSLITLISMTAAGQELNPKILEWGSASLGSMGYVCIEAFTSTLNKLTDLRNSSISTAGGAENLALIHQGEIHLGQGMSTDLNNAYNGLVPYSEKIEFAQLFAYSSDTLPICVMMDSDITTIEDLKGKRLQVGPASGGAVSVMRAILEGYGILDEVQFVYLGWSEAADALRLGQVDASAVWHGEGYIPHTGFQRLALTHEFRVLDMDYEILKSVSEKNAGLIVSETLEKTFDFYDGNKVSPGLSSVLVCNPNLDEEIVYQIVKTLFENEEDVRQIDEQSLAGFYLERALKNIISSYPIHPGAARYYKEAGVWEDHFIIYE